MSDVSPEVKAQKFRIDATEYAGNGNIHERYAGKVPAWFWSALESGIAFNRDGRLILKTLEGEHVVSDGDWIVRGIKGELYPCKPDIFAATYEPAGSLSSSSSREVTPTGERETEGPICIIFSPPSVTNEAGDEVLRVWPDGRIEMERPPNVEQALWALESVGRYLAKLATHSSGGVAEGPETTIAYRMSDGTVVTLDDALDFAELAMESRARDSRVPYIKAVAEVLKAFRLHQIDSRRAASPPSSPELALSAGCLCTPGDPCDYHAATNVTAASPESPPPAKAPFAPNAWHKPLLEDVETGGEKP